MARVSFERGVEGEARGKDFGEDRRAGGEGVLDGQAEKEKAEG